MLNYKLLRALYAKLNKEDKLRLKKELLGNIATGINYFARDVDFGFSKVEKMAEFFNRSIDDFSTMPRKKSGDTDEEDKTPVTEIEAQRAKLEDKVSTMQSTINALEEAVRTKNDMIALKIEEINKLRSVIAHMTELNLLRV